MRKILSICLLLSFVVSVNAHDLFLKMDSFFLLSNDKAIVRLMNGTFTKSDGLVRHERIEDVSVISPSGLTHPGPETFRDEEKTTLLEVPTNEAGTYVVGISTKQREIELKSADFNNYLKHDGIPDILALRKKNKELNKSAKERYSKHVRTIFQVGDTRTDDYKKPLGYPVEIIPQQNPYGLKVGQMLEVLCTLDGNPLVNQYVLVGRETRGRLARETALRTEKNGIARFRLSSKGKWYVKFIHMTPIKEGDLNYESKWATLTFEIK